MYPSHLTPSQIERQIGKIQIGLLFVGTSLKEWDVVAYISDYIRNYVLPFYIYFYGQWYIHYKLADVIWKRIFAEVFLNICLRNQATEMKLNLPASKQTETHLISCLLDLFLSKHILASVNGDNNYIHGLVLH